MEKVSVSALEKEMAAFDIEAVQAEIESAKLGFATTASFEDIRDKVCSIWSRVRRFVVLAGNIPIVGNYIKMLINLLDLLCPQARG